MKQVIRLTESELRNIVMEAVCEVEDKNNSVSSQIGDAGIDAIQKLTGMSDGLSGKCKDLNHKSASHSGLKYTKSEYKKNRAKGNSRIGSVVKTGATNVKNQAKDAKDFYDNLTPKEKAELIRIGGQLAAKA